MRRVLFALAALAIIAIGLALRPGALDLAARSTPYDTALAQAQSPADRGIAAFAFGDWGALGTHTLEVSAVPWRLSTAALALAEADGDPARVTDIDLEASFRRFWIHSPDEIANWPAHMDQPSRDAPLGLIRGTASGTWPPVEVTIGNSVCAACHSSVTYDARGRPDPTRVWLGMGNSSINLDSYTQALFAAFRDHDDATLMQAARALHPDMSARETLTLRYAILPRLRALVDERAATIDSFLPFRISTVGATNGLDSLRNRLDLIPEGEVVTESTFNSLPDLGDRLLRNRLLTSGSYVYPDADTPLTPADIDDDQRDRLAQMIAYFTVPAMGVSEAVAKDHRPMARDVVAWLETYEPQPFPGVIDPRRATAGRALYSAHCAACHGTYDDSLDTPRLVSFPNWHGPYGTDQARIEVITPQVVEAINASLDSPVRAAGVTGYSAPPLSGLWASAPYLHNGSVPTLWHLMHPDQRPTRFQTGGHALDFDRVGIAGTLDGDTWRYPAGHTPWSEPIIVDTRDFGMGNQGHAAEFAPLSEADKAALLEYLKLL